MTITIYSRTDRIYLKKKVSYRNRQNERPKKKKWKKNICRNQERKQIEKSEQQINGHDCEEAI